MEEEQSSLQGVCGKIVSPGKSYGSGIRKQGNREGYREFVDFGTIFLEGIVGGSSREGSIAVMGRRYVRQHSQVITCIHMALFKCILLFSKSTVRIEILRF